MSVALENLFDEFTRNHERDAALARIGTFHSVHVAEARGAAVVPAPGRALDRIVGEGVDAPSVSLFTRLSVLFRQHDGHDARGLIGSLGSSLPNCIARSK